MPARTRGSTSARAADRCGAGSGGAASGGAGAWRPAIRSGRGGGTSDVPSADRARGLRPRGDSSDRILRRSARRGRRGLRRRGYGGLQLGHVARVPASSSPRITACARSWSPSARARTLSAHELGDPIAQLVALGLDLRQLLLRRAAGVRRLTGLAPQLPERRVDLARPSVGRLDAAPPAPLRARRSGSRRGRRPPRRRLAPAPSSRRRSSAAEHAAIALVALGECVAAPPPPTRRSARSGRRRAPRAERSPRLFLRAARSCARSVRRRRSAPRAGPRAGRDRNGRRRAAVRPSRAGSSRLRRRAARSRSRAGGCVRRANAPPSARSSSARSVGACALLVAQARDVLVEQAVVLRERARAAPPSPASRGRALPGTASARRRSPRAPRARPASAPGPSAGLPSCSAARSRAAGPRPRAAAWVRAVASCWSRWCSSASTRRASSADRKLRRAACSSSASRWRTARRPLSTVGGTATGSTVSTGGGVVGGFSARSRSARSSSRSNPRSPRAVRRRRDDVRRPVNA